MGTGAAGFRARPGQREMAQATARAFAAATLGETQDVPQRAIAVVQAGTGVGKSAAYNAVGIAIAKMRKTKMVISTASVALQEQLVNKDLPLLARHMPEPFSFALAKGRGRYVWDDERHPPFVFECEQPLCWPVRSCGQGERPLY